MSLFFAERINEQIEDRQKDKIVFTFPWIYALNGREIDENSRVGDSIRTSYKMATTLWDVHFKNKNKTIFIQNAFSEEWNGRCFISYTLFYDTDMRFIYYSSTRVQMNEKANDNGYGSMFLTPEGYMSRFIEARKTIKLSKIVLFIELHLSTKCFYQPAIDRGRWESGSDSENDEEESKDIENLSKSEDGTKSYFVIKCRDGTVSAQRNILFTSSSTMKFSKLHQSECDVEYTVAVIKPIIDFFHSLSLQLPESYTHNYANEILNAFKFFKPVRKLDMKEKLHYSICNYFAKEKHTFDSILLWLSVACTHGIPDLREMICALIANEYYFKWQQKFPVTARNMENPLYRQLFKGRYVGTLFAAKVDRIYSNSFLTNLILQ